MPPRRSACAASEIFLASTGVIGEPLDADKFAGVHRRHGRAAGAGAVDGRRQGDHDHRHLPQARDRDRRVRRRRGHDLGIAKGSGMIAPDMATMLSFVFTDAPIARDGAAGAAAAGRSRRASTPSPSTATPRPPTRCLVFATGKAGDRCRSTAPTIRAPRSSAKRCGDVLHDLAIQVVRDGEGATKLVTVNVEGADQRRRAPSASPSRSPTRRWSRPRLPARTPTGAASSWPSARPASRPTATSSSIRFGDLIVAEDGERAAGLRRGRDQRLHEGRGARTHASTSASARARRRSTPAT